MKNKWPELSFEKGKETYETLHLFTQVIGKIKLKVLPWTNHSWHVVLFVTPSGLSTSHIQCSDRHFQIDFNFHLHQLMFQTSEGDKRQFDLAGLTVAAFYTKVFATLSELNITVQINKKPNEIADAIPLTRTIGKENMTKNRRRYCTRRYLIHNKY